jgi:hypothetical protein
MLWYVYAALLWTLVVLVPLKIIGKLLTHPKGDK